MAKQKTRYNPWHPKVNLYDYKVTEGRGSKRINLQSGRRWATSISEVKNDFKRIYGNKAVVTVNKLDKKPTLRNYGTDPGYKTIRIGENQPF